MHNGELIMYQNQFPQYYCRNQNSIFKSQFGNPCAEDIPQCPYLTIIGCNNPYQKKSHPNKRWLIDFPWVKKTNLKLLDRIVSLPRTSDNIHQNKQIR